MVGQPVTHKTQDKFEAPCTGDSFTMIQQFKIAKNQAKGSNMINSQMVNSRKYTRQ